jgi:hypothetical protein
LYGAPRFALYDCRSIPDLRASAYFVDTKFDYIASTKFAIYRQIKERKVAPHLRHL